MEDVWGAVGGVCGTWICFHINCLACQGCVEFALLSVAWCRGMQKSWEECVIVITSHTTLSFHQITTLQCCSACHFLNHVACFSTLLFFFFNSTVFSTKLHLSQPNQPLYFFLNHVASFPFSTFFVLPICNSRRIQFYVLGCENVDQPQAASYSSPPWCHGMYYVV